MDDVVVVVAGRKIDSGRGMFSGRGVGVGLVDSVVLVERMKVVGIVGEEGSSAVELTAREV